MIDSYLTTRFLLLVHATGAIGMAAWYFGWIPRGSTARRYLPFGLYMSLIATRELVTWSTLFDVPATPIPFGVHLAITLTAFCLLLWAFILNHKGDRTSDSWPLAMRAGIILHFVVSYGLLFTASSDRSQSNVALPATFGSLTMLWLIFSHKHFLPRRGHYLHWSMVCAVLLSLALSWVAINRVYHEGLRHREDVLTHRVATFAELLEAGQIHADNKALTSALAAMCRQSNFVTGAFLLPADQSDPRCIAKATSELLKPVPIMASTEIYFRHASFNMATHRVFLDFEDDLEWRMATAPIRLQSDAPPVAILGVLAPTVLVEASLAETMRVTEVIVLLVALVILICIGGYLHSVVRVWHRDTLLEINAALSQKLLHQALSTEVVGATIRQLYQRLHLLHASLWVYRDNGDHTKFRPPPRSRP
ncbi:MAG: hypothetical protein J6386_20425 [Candidatus Synoicihabitans palmerolidicus]|nr:hypothetical protein [Candidatus Synoicihabitans palmerolidicus]